MPFTSFSTGTVGGGTKVVTEQLNSGGQAAQGTKITAIVSALRSFGGKPVPQTGQMFPSRTA